MLVDTGSSVNALYLGTFKKLGLKKKMLRPINTPLSGITGDSVQAEGAVSLPVEVGEYPCLAKVIMEFVVVDLECTHNVIMGRLFLEDLGAIISLEHLTMKFRMPEGVGIARCEQKAARDCYLRACKRIGEKDMRVHSKAERASKEDSMGWPGPAVELG